MRGARQTPPEVRTISEVPSKGPVSGYFDNEEPQNLRHARGGALVTTALVAERPGRSIPNLAVSASSDS